MRIYKGTINKFENKESVELPKGAHIFRCGNVLQEIVFWYTAEETDERETVVFNSCCTGDEIPSGKYLGSVVLHGGMYERHIFLNQWK